MLVRSLRFVTLNTWKNDGDYFARLRAMIAGLRALEPDVVLLQEAFRTADDKVHTARSLADALSLTLAYQPARAFPRVWQGDKVQSESGLAILVRGTFTSRFSLALPSDEQGGERIALIAAATVGGHSVMVGCTHLSHLRDDDARRREQLETLLAYPGWSMPTDIRVLGGDFNSTIRSDALNWLETYPALSVRNVFGPDLPQRATYPLPPRPERAGRAIDFLFTVSALSAENTPRAIYAGLGLDSPIDGIWPSDHAAVVADLQP